VKNLGIYKLTMDLIASVFFSSVTPCVSFNLTSVAAHTIMYPFTSLLVMGSLAVQAVLSLPDPSRVKEREAEILKRSVDSFIATESPIALAVCCFLALNCPPSLYTFEIFPCKCAATSCAFEFLNEQD
jgi:hypothetical protein